MSYEVFGVLRQSVDQGLDLVDPRFSFFLRALYPKEPSLALVEFLQARFKNVKRGPEVVTATEERASELEKELEKTKHEQDEALQ
ncbi:hypothetical protein BHE74_00056875 [Ensete ventricosum]|nr:hypothetical protein BHE74_00056875 [Ensete ventricosum]